MQAPELLQRVRPDLQPRERGARSTAIEAITPRGIRTVDGVEHALDVLVLATGFKVFEKGNMPPFAVRGAGGSSWRSGGARIASRPTRA